MIECLQYVLVDVRLPGVVLSTLMEVKVNTKIRCKHFQEPQVLIVDVSLAPFVPFGMHVYSLVESAAT